MSTLALPRLIAHRGCSARHPEQTRAAYAAAIAWSADTGVPVGLECDVHFTSDWHLVCLHDLTVDRTSNGRGAAFDHTLAQLRVLDFGSWKVAEPTGDQRALVTLAELVTMTAAARERGVDVSLVIETKHPNPSGTAVEDEVARLLHAQGWDRAGSPVQLISFSAEGLSRAKELLPDVPRTLLIEVDLDVWRDGDLPDGVSSVGPDLRLLRVDPGFVARSTARGHAVDVWTVNRLEDARFLRDLGVRALTTDDPEAVADALLLAPTG